MKFAVGPQGFFATASAPVFGGGEGYPRSRFNTCQPGELDASTPYGFLGFNGSIGATITTLKVIKKEYPKAKKILFVTADDGAIPYLMPRVKKLAVEYGFALAADTVPFPNEMEDFNPSRARVNAVKDADVVFMLNGSPVAVGLVAKGLPPGNNTPVVHSGVPSCQTIMDISGKDAANDIISMSITPHAKGNPALLDGGIYDRSKSAEPIRILCPCPEVARVLTRVIQAANSFDPAVVKAKWETMDKVDWSVRDLHLRRRRDLWAEASRRGPSSSVSKTGEGKVVYGGWWTWAGFLKDKVAVGA